MTITTLSPILFILGMLVLLFGKTKEPIYDIIGFILIIVGYGLLYSI